METDIPKYQKLAEEMKEGEFISYGKYMGEFFSFKYYEKEKTPPVIVENEEQKEKVEKKEKREKREKKEKKEKEGKEEEKVIQNGTPVEGRLRLRRQLSITESFNQTPRKRAEAEEIIKTPKATDSKRIKNNSIKKIAEIKPKSETVILSTNI